MNIREELITRYTETGRIGFVKPKSYQEAIEIINAIAGEEPQEEQKIAMPEKMTIADLTNYLKSVLES